MKRFLCSMIAFVAIIGWPRFVQADTSKTTADDLKAIVACMKTETCKHTISDWADTDQTTYGLSFEWGHKHYTLMLAGPPVFSAPSLDIHVREAGAGNQSSLEQEVIDHGLDGVVDFGLQGPVEHRKKWHRRFDSGKFGGAPCVGGEFQDFWQKQFDDAIAAAKQRLL